MEEELTIPQELAPDADLTDDDIAAALGFATTLGEEALPFVPLEPDDMDEEEPEPVEVEEEVTEEPLEEPVEEETTEEPVEDAGPSETEQAILTKLDELDKKIDDVGKKTDIDKELEHLEKELETLKKDARETD